MVILGWIALVLISLIFSGGYVAMLFDSLGTYNIGGSPNSRKKKLTVLAFGVLAAIWWLWVFSCAPFTLTLNTNPAG